MGVTSEGDARENESDSSGSEFGPSLGEFGPPVSEFGPPVAEFGPPVAEFGPPMGTDTGPRWQVPQQPTDHPELGWRPAGEPETTPPLASQFRAPDATVFAESAAAAPEPPAARPQPKGGEKQDSWWNQPTAEGGVPKPPPPADSGLSWAEDPIAMRLALRVPTTPAPVRSSRHSRRWGVLGAVAAVVVLIALTVTIIAVSGDNGDSGAAPGVGGTTAALSCPSNKDGKVTVGNGTGDTSSGPGAILGFQYSFYVERSGERARRFVADDAENVSTADRIQKGIDEYVPVGTTHCLRITELATDTFDVDLTEHRPDGTTTVYRQTVTTVARDGKTVVYAIRDRL
ncbi:hypothetical protein IU486_26305 [Streptomyces gardneri]|nr:hypothetical protein [Streptomyces gardneri]MBF6204683.1 hypothetical protein [Streptomyces gardneri]